MNEEMLEKATELVERIEAIEIQELAKENELERLKTKLEKLYVDKKISEEKLEIALGAVAILQKINEASVQKSYKFIEANLNNALSKIFDETTRKIRLEETTYRETYPQLDIILEVENGNTRSIASDSGHGLQQIISFLCILCIIVVSGERKIMVMDEILSGLSAKARKIIDEIMNQFATNLGFQFIIIEHGFVPKNSLVYHLEMKDNISRIKETYVEETGVADFVE